MITKNNFKALILKLGFSGKGNILTKKFKDIDTYLKVDFKTEKLIYPEDKGFIVNSRDTCNFRAPENFVVFECVHRLFEQGYEPKHIELEQTYSKIKKDDGGGRADIILKNNNQETFAIIECKRPGDEFVKHWKKTELDGDQLFRYLVNKRETQYLCLYASGLEDGHLFRNYHLISLVDNENYLEEIKATKPVSFKIARSKNKEDLFRVWKETYHSDFVTNGLLEEDIEIFTVGKSKYTVNDLKPISASDIQGKYHEFATILRQHNVSGRENAFDKLVNLFLCKIVDEKINHSDLLFNWKGFATDDQFNLIDRLQKLYQEGMQRFLNEDVVYISVNQIEEAFHFFRNDKDATKEKIQEYFKQLKFFNNNDFGFIDVHNEKLFHQNAKVLLKIVQMLQDIRLRSDIEKGSEENQFLGDMFEGFLDQGVKQSEGQFFTPMPIVKFILKSLPLESIITKGDEIPKVIDYACGAGHFLNEYAKEIKSIVEKEKEAKITDFYENVYGIEKEYRLSKVAKVSSFMYGQDDINIVYSDALSSGKAMDDKNIRDSSFSVLVANPPYSVKGFLETLSETERKRYELIETVGEKSYPNNNSIETFFIERAKQLLKPGGVAGIIVPSSILTKGKAKSTSKSTNIYVATREILLKYFDIVAIAEFGSGTFGKTGTNTVTLFIRRKKENPSPADHFKNRVNAWFNYDKSKDGLFEDENLLKQYCNHLELEFEDYQTLLKGEPSEKLLNTDIFKEYRKEFDKWSEIKNLKKKTTFKALTPKKKEAELKKRFIAYLTENEKEKLYYFVLASQNPQKVLIVKSPSKSKEMKEFLGYEWSTAKGNEGIKYLGGVQLDKMEGEDEDEGNVALEEEDKRVLSNIFNLNNINTPLYDPQNKKNEKKINHIINQNFEGAEIEIPKDIENNVTQVRLIDMLDFSRPDFNKFISLTPKKSIFIETKWDLVKLGMVCNQPQYGANESAIDGNPQNDYRYIRITDIDENGQLLSDFKTAKTIEEKFILKEGDFLFARSGNTVGKTFLYRKEFGKALYAGYLIRFRTNKSKLLPEFLDEYTNLPIYQSWVRHNQTGSSQPNINGQIYSSMLIPLPPIDIQKQIIKECSIFNNEAKKAKLILDKSKNEIETLFNDASTKSNITYKLSNTDIFELSIGKRILKDEINNDDKGIPVYSANVFEPFGYIEKELLKDFDTPSVLWGIDGDWMVNVIPAKEPFYPTDHCGVLRIKNNEVHHKYLAWVLQKEGERVRFSRTNRASMDSMRGLSIKAPSEKIQTELIKKVEKLEKKIKDSQDIINGIAKRKEAVIKSYLMGEVEKSELDMAAEPNVNYNK